MTSILGGPDGTSHRYAKQKGASPEEIVVLAEGIESYATLLARHTSWDLRLMPGTGAAGGLGAGLLALLNARLTYSMSLIRDFLDIDSHLAVADIVVTGEGMLDSGSTAKAACAIGLLAKRYDLQTIAIAGSMADDVDIVFFHGIDFVEVCLQSPMSPEDAIEPLGARKRLLEASIRVGRNIRRNPSAWITQR